MATGIEYLQSVMATLARVQFDEAALADRHVVQVLAVMDDAATHLSDLLDGLVLPDEPCCIAFVTSGGRDHEPDCTNR